MPEIAKTEVLRQRMCDRINRILVREDSSLNVGVAETEHISYETVRIPPTKTRNEYSGAMVVLRQVFGQSRTNQQVRAFRSSVKSEESKALIDTGSDITIAGTEVAKRCRWRIRPCELDTVTVANGENMVIDGIATENLSVGNRSVASRIHVSSDMSGLILGVD